jgi:hypothetical protein
MGMGGVVEAAPGCFALGPCRRRFRIDFDRLHARQVDHDGIVGGAEAGDAVRASTNRDSEVAVAREFTAATTSSTPAHRTMTRGRRSIIAL